MPHKPTEPFNIPLSILISKDVDNLMMAGRNMSCSHLAFSCTRVMNTGSVAGQSAGTAAALAARKNILPKQIVADKSLIGKLQQNLLRDGQIILGVANSDPDDIARSAKISATESASESAPQNVASGMFFDKKGENKNKWLAPIADKPELKLEWDSPREISHVALMLDTGFRHLTMTLEVPRAKIVLHAPQPETLKDFDISAVLPDGSEKILAQIRGNYQRRVLCDFAPTRMKALKIKCLATCGDPMARIFEVRAKA